jgi:prepilin-type processing-associated H-X9-DG protein
MKTVIVTSITLSIVLVSLAIRSPGADEKAENKLDAAARAQAIAPWLDDETFAVVHIDLRRVSVGATLDAVAPLKLAPAEELAAIKAVAGMYQSRLTAAGAKDIYAFIGLAGGPPFLRVFGAIPLDAGSDEKAIRSMFPIYAVERRGDLLLIAGNRNMLAEVTGNTPEPRPELAAAIEAAGDSAAQLLVLPPKHWKRVIEEGIGEFPRQFGGGSIDVLTRGALWIVVGIDLPPHAAVHVTIQSEDRRAAAALQQKLDVQFQRAAQGEAARRDVPRIDEAMKLLTPTVDGSRLRIDLDENNHGVERVIAALSEPFKLIQRRGAQVQSANNLRQIALAMHNYHSAHKSFPLPASAGADGKPLLSWRVAILPYLGQEDLYKKFHLDEPWDSANNRPLVDKMPAEYRSPMTKNKEPGRTNYLLPVGNGAGFTSDKPTQTNEIADGMSNTVMIAEVDDDHAVPWTKPDDWQFDPQQPSRGLAQFFNGRFNAAFFDGSVHAISATLDPKSLKALFTRAAGDIVGDY